MSEHLQPEWVNSAVNTWSMCSEVQGNGGGGGGGSLNMDVLFCADAVRRLSERGGPAADWGGEMAPPGGGERTEHPEGGHTNVQRRRTVRARDRLLFSPLTPLHFPFSPPSDL